MHTSKPLRFKTLWFSLLLLGLVAIAVFLWHPDDGGASKSGGSDLSARASLTSGSSTANDTSGGTVSSGPVDAAEQPDVNAGPVAGAQVVPVANHSGIAPDPKKQDAVVGNPAEPVRRPSVREAAAGGKTAVAILRGQDMADPAVRARVVEELNDLNRTQSKAVEEKARLLGIPLRVVGPGHQVSELYDIRGNDPVYRETTNVNAAITSGANLLAPAPYGLDGTGIKVAVWDGGAVRNTHQEFGTRITKKNNVTVDDHATHVAGTISAAGVNPAAKGMAPQIHIDSYDWNSDYAEMAAAGATTAGDSAHIGLSNHSYGFRSVTDDMGRYETEASTVDELVASLPFYLPCWAAGNAQGVLTAKGGYQSITYMSLAKNILTVGATEDAVAGGVRNPALGTITEFSSLGPCDDGRIKPDVVANGRDLTSSVSTSNTAYDVYSGTSMATPSTTGSAALVEQLYAREFSGQRMRNSMMKALLIHTADDVGNPGPDYKYGWGLLNVKAACDLILVHKSALAVPKMIEGSVTNAAKSVDHTFLWDGTSPIRATVCWTDPAGAAQTSADSRTPNLVHNLDLKITAPDGTTVTQPFVMPFVGNWSQASMSSAAVRGKNNTDNVEQVYIPAPNQVGVYTVTVSVSGNLTTASQIYSLVMTGGVNVESNPPPSVVLTSPSNGSAYLPGAAVTVSANASDFAIGGQPGAIAKVEFFQGSTLIGTDTTAPYSLSWTPPSSGFYSITAKATDNENAESVSAAVGVTVLTGNGVPVISSFAPQIGKAGDSVVISGLNLVGITSVKIGGAEADFVMNSNGTITAVVPTAATTGPIQVTNTYGTGASSTNFTITESPLLISQIYGAGGNTGAAYNRDYVEIYNNSPLSINLSGISLQCASSTGPVWTVVPLSGTLAAGKYYLIGLATGSSGSALPAVNASGSYPLNASSGKVALRNSITPITGTSALGVSGVLDFVGYGDANAYEGSDAAPAPGTSTAAFRINDGKTDTNDNRADFIVQPPNPRNMASAAAVLPVLTSSQSAYGNVGKLFYYQITATNFPTSYSANIVSLSTLPAGLSVDPVTGVMSGIPTQSGYYNIEIKATNAAGTNKLTIGLSLYPAYTGLRASLFSENFGVPLADTPAATYTGYQNISPVGYTGSNISTAYVKASKAPAESSGYSGASAGGYMKFLSNNTTEQTFEISGIDTNGFSSLQLSFGYYQTSSGSSPILLEYSTGGSYSSITYTRPSATGVWGLVSNVSLPVSPTKTLKLRFRRLAATSEMRIDDIVLTGLQDGGTTNPIITTSGALTPLSSTYGSPSAGVTSFTLSGEHIVTPGIVITPPPGFEVSTTVGGVSGYAASQTLSTLGTVPVTTVYVRLAATTTAGTYSGNLTCVCGSATANLPVPASEVRAKLLTITAKDRSKAFGTTLTAGFGPGQAGTTYFTTSGLVSPQTLGSVTLTPSGGTAANDDAGIYQIVPSAAIGGTFDPGNYEIDYVAGTLTVTPQAYSAWLTQYPGLSSTDMDADPDKDGQTNLMEYYSGTNPGAANGNGVTLTKDGSSVSMKYRRAKGTGGVSGVVKWSDTMNSGSWSSNGITESVNDKGTYEERTAVLPLAPGDLRKFLRLEVTQP